MATRDFYIPQTWENLPSEETPVSAERLDHIESGIETAMENRALRVIYGDMYMDLGYRNQIKNAGFFGVLGMDNCIENAGNFLMAGVGNNIQGDQHGCFGHDNTVTGLGNLVSGKNNVAQEGFSSSLGEGLKTRAYQHSVGKYNIEDVRKKYLEIVGNGTSDSNRSNARTLDWGGNAWYAGDVMNGAGVSLNSLKSRLETINDIAAGVNIAKVFDTKEDLEEWLAVEGNPETLKVGQNIYIAETGTPDYWWDGTWLQVLETDKVEIESMSYDETMAILNATAEEEVA